jgi:DNA-binding GntR family transcriptional regulator
MSENQVTIPRYKELYDTLRKHIISGIYKEGDLIPSENELCRMYETTRPTVRHALDALVNDGFIEKHKGKGSIVHAIHKGIGIMSISGITSAIGKGNLKTIILVKPNIIQWPVPFSYPLSDHEKEFGCIHLERLRYVNNIPIFYDINHIPNMNLPRFCNRNFDDKSLFDMLRRHYGIEIKNGEQKLRALPASNKISEYFAIPEGKPVLYLERKLNTNKSGFSIYSSIYCNTEDYFLYGSF